jgi:hypothetical protein
LPQRRPDPDQVWPENQFIEALETGWTLFQARFIQIIGARRDPP